MTGKPLALVLSGLLLFSVSSAADAQKRQRDRITREEIETSPHRDLDLYQLIRNTRPHFLEPPKGVRSFGNSRAPNTPIALYVDGRKDTGLDALKTLSPLRVEEVRYFDPTRAESEFGPNAAQGAVVVKLRRGARSDVRQAADTSRPPR
jgi:hypothetical protein